MHQEASHTLDLQARTTLLRIARESIHHGLDSGQPLPVNIEDYPEQLQQQRASFVTLNLHGQLRGCIGHLEAIQALVRDVADNGFAAAFEDPRFPPVTESEYPALEVHISVLTPATAMTFASEQDLIEQLRPGVDGLILEDGMARGTFLPAVWESLPEPREFLTHLKYKAGLPANHWSSTLRVSRYETESFA